MLGRVLQRRGLSLGIISFAAFTLLALMGVWLLFLGLLVVGVEVVGRMGLVAAAMVVGREACVRTAMDVVDMVVVVPAGLEVVVEAASAVVAGTVVPLLVLGLGARDLLLVLLPGATEVVTADAAADVVAGLSRRTDESLSRAL